MGRRSTGLALLGLSLALGLPATASAKAKQAVEPYKVLVVTSTSDAVSTAGISAITSAVGADGVVTAPAPADVGAQFTPANLDSYRAVVFLNTGMASPLNDAQRANFEAYYKKGGGFVGIGSAIETDASWSFLSGLLGTRAAGRTESQAATVKVADRVHDASKNLPQYWERTEPYYNFSANVRGVSHVLATVVEKPFEPQPAGNVLKGITGGTMGADHPVAWCKDFQAGRSFYTAFGGSAAAFDADMQKHLKGAISWAAGQSDPTYSDCGATVLKNYQQVKVTAAAEPQRADRLRPAARRAPDPDRPPRWRAPAQPGDRHHDADRRPRRGLAADDAARVHQLRGWSLRPGRGPELRHQQVGVPVLRPADGDERPRGRWLDHRLADDAERDGPELRADRLGVGQVRGLLPALALQVRRGRRRSDAGPRRPSSRSCGSPTTARSAATSRATSTSTSTATCGWSPVTTPRPAASTPTATARSRISSPTSSRPSAPTTRRAAPSR